MLVSGRLYPGIQEFHCVQELRAKGGAMKLIGAIFWWLYDLYWYRLGGFKRWRK
jgi:hypothetical protein